MSRVSWPWLKIVEGLKRGVLCVCEQNMVEISSPFTPSKIYGEVEKLHVPCINNVFCFLAAHESLDIYYQRLTTEQVHAFVCMLVT